MVGKSLGRAGPNEKLREARQERGWRLKDVVVAVQSVEGRSLGLDENTVSRWERGVVEPTDFYKARLCLALEGMAIVEGEAGRKGQATRFLRAATDLRLEMGSRRPVLWQALLDAREISDDTAAEESLFGAHPPGR